MSWTRRGPEPACNCPPCRKKRAANHRWWEKHKHDPEVKAKVKARNRKRTERGTRRLGPDLVI